MPPQPITGRKRVDDSEHLVEVMEDVKVKTDGRPGTRPFEVLAGKSS